MESLFGGLDRQYIVHRLTGRASVLFMLLHPLFLLVQRSFSLETVKLFLVPGLNWSVSLGTISFIIISLLISFTLLIRLPYHIWFITHRFMIVVLILAFVHTVLAGSDVKAHPVMMGVLSIFFAAGVASNFYMTALFSNLIGQGDDLRDRVVMLCGPPAMMEGLSRQFRKLGVPPKNIIYEDFNLLGH